MKNKIYFIIVGVLLTFFTVGMTSEAYARCLKCELEEDHDNCTEKSSWYTEAPSYWHFRDCCCGERIESHSPSWGSWSNFGSSTEHRRRCSVCGLYDFQSHIWNDGEVTTPATCTTPGVRTYTCTTCGATKTGEIPTSGSHTYGAWTTTREATCVQAGEQKRTCSVCGNSETQPIAINPSNHAGPYTTTYSKNNATVHTVIQTCNACGIVASTTTENHTWNSGEITTPATCTTSGVRTYTCKICGETKTETINPLNHDWNDWYTSTEATCTQPEIQTRICKRDASHIETKTLSTIPDKHKDDDPEDGYCDYNHDHDLNTAPTLTLGSFNGEFFKAGEEIILTVSGTKGTGAPEVWDTITFTATLAGKTGTVEASGTGVGTSGGTATIKWNVSALGIADGNYTATVVVTDSRGITDTKTTSDSIIVDTSAPEAPTIVANEDWTNANVEVTITAGNADVAGLDKVTYILTGATTKAETEIVSGGKITISNEGETTITAYTYDKAGNKSEASTKVVRIEKILPTITFTPNGSNGEYAQNFITVVTVEDLGAYVSGLDVSSIKYLWTTTTTEPTEAALSAGTSFTSGSQIATPADATDNYYLWVIAKDNAGNVAIVRSEAFLVDNIEPTVTFVNNENETYEKQHLITVTVKDENGNINSGVNAESLKYLWTESSVAPVEADFVAGTSFVSGSQIATPADVTGEFYLWILAKDNVGNTIISGSGVQRVDNTPPTLEYELLPASPIYSAIKVIVKDEFNGIVRAGVDDNELKYEISLRPVATPAYSNTYINNEVNGFPANIEGQYYIYIIAKDKAGNVTEKQDLLVIDTKQPVITYNPDGNTTFANVQSTVVTITDYSMIVSAKYVWTTSDTEVPADNKFEGIFVTGDTITTPDNLTGDYYLWVMAEDKAGNIVKAVSKVFKLDNTLPKITFGTDGNINYATTHETTVTVTEGANESGVDTSSLKYVWTTSAVAPTKEEFVESFTNGDTIDTPAGVEGTYYLWIYAKDNVGNEVIVGSNLFNLDDKNVVVSFDPFENKIFAPEHSTRVTFSDLGSKVKENSLKYFWTTDATLENPEEALFTNSFVNGSLIKTPEDGQGIYYLWVIGEDNVGNKITARSGEFWVDNTELPINLTIIQNVGITGKGIHVVVDGSVKPFKEDSIKWLISDSPAQPLVSDYQNSTTNDADVLFEKGIEKQAYVWVMAEDENGTAYMEYIYMIIDTKAPTVTFEPNGNASDLTVLETVVTVKDYSIIEGTRYLWTTDATLEPTAEQVSNEFTTGDTIQAPTEDGDYYLWVYAEDLVGNVVLVRSEVFKVDHTAPTKPEIIGKEVDEEGNVSGETLPSGSITNKDVLVEITPGVDDRDEGVETIVTIKKDGTEITITPDEDGNYTLTEEGTYEITVITKDKAENESEPASYEVTIDKSLPAPEISAKEDTPEETVVPDGGATKENVVVKITVEEEDATLDVTITKDGVDITDTLEKDEDGNYILTEEGTYEVKVVAKDNLGNESEEVTYTVTIDGTLPGAPVIIPSEKEDEPTGNPPTIIPDDGSSKENVKVETDEDEDGETTVIKIVDEDGNDRTEEFTNPETGEIVIDKSGEYDIIATTTKDSDPTKKSETTTHIKVDVDAPVANDDEKATRQNTPVEGQVEATDNFGVTEYEVVVTPGHGTVTVDPITGEYVYTPEDGFYGEDNFQVVAKDEVGNISEPATITITVRKKLEEIDILTEKEKEISIYKNQKYTSKELPAVDKNGDALTYEITEEAVNGTVTFDNTTRKITYVPNKDYVGNDTFKLEVTNGKETIIITFNVEVKKKSSGGGSSTGGSKDDEEIVTHTWYIRGYEDGTVRPDGNITREEIAMIFYRLFIGSNNTLSARSVKSYSDVDTNRWSYEAIMYLTQKGILNGYEDGSFKPTAQITRAELAVILQRYANITSKTTTSFTDVASDNWARDAIEKVVTRGWMIGYTDGTFKPNNKLTRAEAVVVINRVLGRNVEDITVKDNPFDDLRTNHWAYEDMLEAITTHTCVLDKNEKEDWKSHEYPYLAK